MKIPALDMQAQLQSVREEIDSAISRVIGKGGFILGQEAKELEQEVVGFTNSGLPRASGQRSRDC